MVKKGRGVEGSGLSLREEAGDGAEALVRVVEIARAELEPVVVEVAVRGPREDAVSSRSELVAREIGVKLLPAYFLFWVRQVHDQPGKGSDAELVGRERLTSTTDGLAAMTHAELRVDHDQIVAFLLRGELVPHLDGTCELAQVLGPELAIAVVVDGALGCELRENEFDRFAVGRGDLLPKRNDELAFGKRDERLGSQLLAHAAEIRELLAQDARLDADRLRARVLHGIGEGRGDLLRHELVHGAVGADGSHERLAESGLERARILDELLRAFAVHADLYHEVLDEHSQDGSDLTLLTVRSARDRLGRHRRLLIIPLGNAPNEICFSGNTHLTVFVENGVAGANVLAPIKPFSTILNLSKNNIK